MSLSLKKLYSKKYVKCQIQRNKTTPINITNIKKIVIFSYFNKETSDNEKYQKEIDKDFFNLFGLLPLNIKAKRSVASYKIRKGMVMGKKLVLGKNLSFLLLTRLVFYILPSYKGFFITKSNFDKQGNFNFGIEKQTIFPETILSEKKFIFGININIVFTKKDKEENLKFLKFFNLPFSKFSKHV